MPHDCLLTGDCDIEAMAGDEAGRDNAPLGRFSGVAYSGAAIRQRWSEDPIVVDLSSLDVSRQTVPLQYEHAIDADGKAILDTDRLLGQTRELRNTGRELYVAGEILSDEWMAERIVRLARRGYRWQLSIGAKNGRVERVKSGVKVQVNGRDFTGPLSIVRGAVVREVSVVKQGADADTSVAIAAQASLEDDMSKPLDSGAEGDNAASTPAGKPVTPAAGATEGAVTASATTAPKGGDGASGTDGVSPEVVASLRKEVAQLRDEGAKRQAEWEKRLQLAEIRASREDVGGSPADLEPDRETVVTATLCRQAGMVGWDKHFGERVAEATDKAMADVSLSSVLIDAAQANGCTHRRMNRHSYGEIIAAAFATHSLANIFENVANKLLLAGFLGVDQSYRRIAAISSVNDFKESKRYRVNGAMQFVRLGPSGEFKMAAVSDVSRSIKADGYGIGTTVSREAIINDDMSALSDMQRRIGRGGALALNEVVWATFLDGNAAYYKAVTPAAGNAFGITSLGAAVQAALEMTDPDGKPLAVRHRMLLVPPAIYIPARNLSTSPTLITGDGTKSSSAREPQQNPFAGEYEAVTSPYLSNVRNAAGTQLGSSTTWWLVTDPADFAPVEIVFLGNQQTPTIEQVVPDPFVLGIGFRGYFDFGVAKADSESCLRMATA